MSRSVYLAATEARSGKSAVAIALLARLGRHAGRILPFRPVVDRIGDDELLDVLRAELGPDVPSAAQLSGVAYDDLHADPDASMGVIVDRFHEVAALADLVLVVGSDFGDVSGPTEFDLNARIAANLGSQLVVVLPSGDRPPAVLGAAAEAAVSAAAAAHATVAAVVVNQAPAFHQDAYAVAVAERVPQMPTAVLPQLPVLSAPTVQDLAEACDGYLAHGDESLLDRESLGLIVASMTMPHVLDRLAEGVVVVVPGDREEVILAAMLAHRSHTFPSLAGIVLNGGFALSPQIQRLIEGLDVDVPIIACDGGTMHTVTALTRAQGRITTASTRKIEVARRDLGGALAESSVLDALAVPSRPHVVTPLMFEHDVVEAARVADRHIVLPEGAEPRILAAAREVRARRIARLTLLGDRAAIEAANQGIGLDLDDVTILDPHAEPLRTAYARDYARLRAHKGMTPELALDVVVDPSYFGTLMVHAGAADAMVSGSVTTTAATVRPALEIVRTAAGVSVVSSVFFMCLADRVLVYGDCAINPSPDAGQLADIAISSARTAAQFGIEPRVAMLSYSTGASGHGADVDKVREATALVRERAPQLLVEGPIQYDAAVDPAVAAAKLHGSQVAGRATVLVFPDLNTGNNTYKAVQRSARAVAIGPILQGLRAPVNDLSRGSLVRDIVNTIAITAVQAGDV